MTSSLDRLKALSSKLEEKTKVKQAALFEEVIPVKREHIPTEQVVLNQKTALRITEETSDTVRYDNIERVKMLYDKLNISEKSPNFDTIFIYKAMNLSGIGLKEDDFADVREGKYIQIIAITYEPDKNGKKKAKNISLGYFGKAETLAPDLKNDIVEFVLRWRYEKAFQNVEHYKDLIAKIKTPDSLF